MSRRFPRVAEEHLQRFASGGDYRQYARGFRRHHYGVWHAARDGGDSPRFHGSFHPVDADADLPLDDPECFVCGWVQVQGCDFAPLADLLESVKA
jgi:hypothetical protein